jgi:hypothetical protein
MAEATPLEPPDIREFDFGGVLLIIGVDKLVFQVKHAPDHLTMHMGTDSKKLDIHRTTPKETPRHRTLFRIDHAKIEELVQEIAPAVATELLRLSRSLRPGWMIRNSISAVTGIIPPEGEEKDVTTIRKKRATVDVEKVKARIQVPEFIDELYVLPEGQFFSLFEVKNPKAPRLIGLGYRVTDARGEPRLRWIKNQDFLEAFKRISGIVAIAAKRHGDVLAELPWF